MASVNRPSAAEAARAVNEILRLDCEDSARMLEVIDDYLNPPSDSEHDSDLEMEDSQESVFFNEGV